MNVGVMIRKSPWTSNSNTVRIINQMPISALIIIGCLRRQIFSRIYCRTDWLTDMHRNMIMTTTNLTPVSLYLLDYFLLLNKIINNNNDYNLGCENIFCMFDRVPLSCYVCFEPFLLLVFTLFYGGQMSTTSVPNISSFLQCKIGISKTKL